MHCIFVWNALPGGLLLIGKVANGVPDVGEGFRALPNNGWGWNPTPTALF